MKILIIQTAFLGDVILSLPLVQVLKDKMQDCIIDYLCIPKTQEILHNNPSIDNVIVYDKRGESNGLNGLNKVIGEVKAKHCIIVDDMVDSGGTLCNAADALIAKGANSVSAYITHGVLSGAAHEKIANSKLKNLVITNSIEPTKETLAVKNIKIINIASLLGEAIRNISQEKSLSILFD